MLNNILTDMLTKSLKVLTIIIAFFSSLLYAQEWPQEVKLTDAVVTIYQPQPDTLNGNLLTGRAAVSIEKKGAEPIFGASWFSANIETDKNNDIANIYSIELTKTGWPSSHTDQEQLNALVKEAFSSSKFTISLTALSKSISNSTQEKAAIDGIKNQPPKIIFADQVSVLLSYDGEPKFTPMSGTKYERAENAAFAVIKDPSNKSYYLTDGSLWYQSNNPLTDWKLTQNIPSDLKSLIPVQPDDEESAPSEISPQIISTIEPAELIVTAGAPDWQTLPNSNLLYVNNTVTPWVRDIDNQKMYILLSGRWFSASSQSGPWDFVRSDQLPASFQSIPADSDIGGIRVAISGTEEANSAVVEAQIPQTSVINRKTAQLNINYDGTPQFQAIPNTDISYAINTDAQVLLISGVYYAVDNGVWFTSKSPTTGWVVADKVPEEQISKIPPSSPVYNLSYVHIYSSTPEVVYVGYTSGYLWSFPYYGVPIYGTGWYYPPYWGNVYYPRPPTWGFNIGYNPWYGWGFGASWSYGFFNVGFGWNWGGPHYNPWRGWNNGFAFNYYNNNHRPYYGNRIIKTGDIKIGNNINIGNRNNITRNNITKNSITKNNLTQKQMDRNNQAVITTRLNKPEQIKITNKLTPDNKKDITNKVSHVKNNGQNIYSLPKNQVRNAEVAPSKPIKNIKSSQKANDIYTDQQGAIVRDKMSNDRSNWQTLKDNQGRSSWQNIPKTESNRSNIDLNKLNRDRQIRQSQGVGGRFRQQP